MPIRVFLMTKRAHGKPLPAKGIPTTELDDGLILFYPNGILKPSSVGREEKHAHEGQIHRGSCLIVDEPWGRWVSIGV